MTLDVETVFGAYVECALWSSMDWADDQGGEPLDRNYGPDDLADEAAASMRADVEAFVDSCHREGWAGEYVAAGGASSQFGHDFWLTRNHHGAGFWDRGLGSIGDVLTKQAHAFGECDLYVGDDGALYVS